MLLHWETHGLSSGPNPFDYKIFSSGGWITRRPTTSMKQRLHDVTLASCAAEHHSLGCQPVETATESVCACTHGRHFEHLWNVLSWCNTIWSWKPICATATKYYCWTLFVKIIQKKLLTATVTNFHAGSTISQAVAQTRWSGKVKLTYTFRWLSNKCTNNCYNRTFTVQVIVEDVVRWMLWDSVYALYK